MLTFALIWVCSCCPLCSFCNPALHCLCRSSPTLTHTFPSKAESKTRAAPACQGQGCTSSPVATGQTCPREGVWDLPADQGLSEVLATGISWGALQCWSPESLIRVQPRAKDHYQQLLVPVRLGSYAVIVTGSCVTLIFFKKKAWELEMQLTNGRRLAVKAAEPWTSSLEF